jgi:hypothetical protein
MANSPGAFGDSSLWRALRRVFWPDGAGPVMAATVDEQQHGKRRGVGGMELEPEQGERESLRGRREAALGEPRWRVLLSSIRAIQMELKRRSPERPIGLSGNPAAPESAIVVAELRLGRRLPPSYREFLAFSDGWPRFFENASLLGTGEIGRYPLDSAADRALANERLLPFGADKAGTSLFAFDTSLRLGDGELQVVAWVGGLGIDCRCFTSFLATVLQLCRAELAAARAIEAGESSGIGAAAEAAGTAPGNRWGRVG